MKTDNLLYCLLIITALSSCSKMNDLHDKYLKNGEIIYTGRVDSAQVFGGANRVMLRYYISDSKARTLVAWWNLKTESTQFPIPATDPGNPVDVYINDLEESDIFFDLYTFNADMENMSVPFHVDGTVYGSKYQQTLRPRAVKSTTYDDSQKSLRIEWGDVSDTEIATKLDYTDLNDISRTITIGTEESVTTIPDFKCMPVYYSTVYKPQMAIDEFSTTPALLSYVGNLTDMLKNTKYPFEHEPDPVIPPNGFPNPRWYPIKEWTVNEQGKQNGNVDNTGIFGSRMCISANGSGNDPMQQYRIINGKVYQTIELDAGKYKFDVLVYHKTSLDLYMVVNKGDDLPDSGGVSNDAGNIANDALAYVQVPFATQIAYNAVPPATNAPRTFEVEFELTEKTTVSMGMVANVNNAQLVISQVELWSMY